MWNSLVNLPDPSRMPFDPLPFDPIGPCLCHRRCPTFRKVAARYWVTVDTQGVVPRLDAGVLMELDPGSAGQLICIWTAVIPFIFPESFQLIMRGFPPNAPFAINWEVVYAVFLVPPEYGAVATDPPDPCSFDTLTLLKLGPDPPTFGNSDLVRVDWWKDANDVPH